jgi:hypothetical protein
VIAGDGSQTTSPSADSNPVVVDRTLPNAPSFSPNRRNWRKSSMTVQVDPVAPLAWWNTKCGQTFKVGSSAFANWGASDSNVGLAGPTSGNIYYDTSSKGSKSVSVTVADQVGNTKTISCAYKVG